MPLLKEVDEREAPLSDGIGVGKADEGRVDPKGQEPWSSDRHGELPDVAEGVRPLYPSQHLNPRLEGAQYDLGEGDYDLKNPPNPFDFT